jgi:TRAP-type C4-dicarboxylate transport system substrate-binding protein
MGYPSGYIATQVANDFYDKFRQKEWDAVHVLFFYSTGPQIISTTKKPVKKLEDLKGLKIRAAGRPADVMKNLGGTPVPVEMADIYDGLQRGVVDGSEFDEVNKGWKTGELIKYATLSWPVGTTFTFYVIMNKGKWEKLPEDVKKAFNEVASQFKDKYAVASNAIDIEGREYLKKFGGQLIPLSTEEAAKWVSAAAPTIDNTLKSWRARNTQRGH